MADETLGSLLKSYLAARQYATPQQYARLSNQAGLDDECVERIVKHAKSKPDFPRGTLLKVADALRLSREERTALERVSGYPKHGGFLKESRAERFVEPFISMRRAVLLLTAPEDPSELPYSVRPGSPWATVATRAGIVFGMHDVVVRATTPVGVSVLDYSQMLFRTGQLRSVETIPLRDDMPTYLDKTFTNEYLRENEYYWATIFVQPLGGARDVEFPEIFFEVSEQDRFWGGIHLLTAAITVGQFDSMVEVLAANLELLQRYVRESQKHAWTKYHREAHTITYFAAGLKPKRFVSEF